MTRELKRSHSPYYYMLVLASNAKKRKTRGGQRSRNRLGAAGDTRLPLARQRGSSGAAAYLRYLVDLAPDDAAQIEKAAPSIIGELRTESGAFSGRSKRTFERMSGWLAKWNKNGSHDCRACAPEREADTDVRIGVG